MPLANLVDIKTCSTPDGIKGTLTIGQGWRSLRQRMCSTPDGIKGTLTLAFNELVKDLFNVLNA